MNVFNDWSISHDGSSIINVGEQVAMENSISSNDEFEEIFKTRDLKNACCNSKKMCYNPDIAITIQGIYILATVLWIVFVYWCELYKDFDWFMLLFVLIPPIVFIIGYYNACQVTLEIEDEVLGANYLSFGFLITIILLNWNSPIPANNKNKFFKLLVVAFVMIMLSMIDVWVRKEYMSVVKHIRTILQTAALVLLSIALYSYYKVQIKYNQD